MSSQVLTNQAMDAWVGYLRGHSALTRELNAELVARHGLTLNEDGRRMGEAASGGI